MKTIYVSPGEGAGSGTKTDPFRTVGAAQAEVRRLLAEKGGYGGIEVILAEGEYRLENGLLFSAEDSGTKSRPVVWRGDGEAILSGGASVPGGRFEAPGADALARLSEAARENVLVCDLFALGLDRGDLGELTSLGSYTSASMYDRAAQGPAASEVFFNGSRMTLARWPNKGEFGELRRVIDGGVTGELYLETGQTVSNPDWGVVRNPKGGTIGFYRDQFERISSWKDLDEAWLFGYFMYDWADMSTPVRIENPENFSLTTEYAHVYGFKSGARYYFYNVLEELDTPGEYYIDRDAGLLYLWPEGDISSGEVLLSTLAEDLVTVGDCEYLTFENICFRGGRAGGINAKGSRLTVKNCRFTALADTALAMAGTDCAAENNEIWNVGGAGITLSGGDRGTLSPSGNRAANNLIHHWSELNSTYRPAVGLYGVGALCAHNEMHSAPHLAVLYSGNDHIIEYNRIGNVCTETVDGGAVYGGRDWTGYGVEIRYNYFYDINSEIGRAGGGPIAVYFDDALSGQSAYGNIFRNIGGIGILAGGGRDIVIENNLFIDTPVPIHFDSRAIDGMHGGWYAHMVVPEDGTMWTRLAAVPYQSGIWAEKYPNLAKISADRDDMENPDFACNPSGGSVADNVLLRSGEKLGNISDPVLKFSSFSANLILPGGDPALSEDGDIPSLGGDSLAFSELPDFRAIPVEKIGRIPSGE